MLSFYLRFKIFFIIIFGGLIFNISSVYAGEWFDCAYVEKDAAYYNILVSIQKGDADPPVLTVDNAVDFWVDAMNLDKIGLHCASVNYEKDVSCSVNTDCPQGFYCESLSNCQKLNCSNDEDCEKVGGKNAYCDASSCFSATDDHACACSNNSTSCFSPTCNKAENFLFTGECVGGECQTDKSSDYCDKDTQCWSGIGNKGTPTAQCCVGNRCVGELDKCLVPGNFYPICPPGYIMWNEQKDDKGIITAANCMFEHCPLDNDEQCNTDADCEKINGEHGKYCEKLTEQSFGKYKEHLLAVCLKEGISGRCSKNPTSTAVPPPVAVPFPDTSSLNQLSSTDIKVVIGNIIKNGVGLMGSIALAMFVYGGVLWMSSAGNAERSKKGTQVILWSALGMFMILISYVIVNFIFEAFR